MTSTELEGWHPGEVDTDPVHLAYQETQAQVVDRYVQGRLASLGEFGEWLSNCGWGIHHQAWLAAYGVLRLPAELGRLVRDSPRGLGVVVRAWGPWVSGSRQNERIRLAIASQDIERALDAKKRDRIVGGVLTFLFVALVAGATWVGWHHAPIRTVLAWLGAVLALGVVARMSRGERVLPRPDVPVGRVITSAAIVDAFAPLCKKDTAAVVLGVPHRKGEGWYAVVQVPAGLEVSQVMSRRATIAQGLKVAEDRVSIDPLPMSAADQLGLYVADRHPMDVEIGRAPVLDADRTDMWQGVPLGPSADGLVVMSVIEGHVMVAGATGTGKSHVLRNIVNTALLDPQCEPVVWDFKGAGDFVPYRKVIKVQRGSGEATVTAFAAWLRWLVTEEMPRRGAALDGLVDAELTDDTDLTRWASDRLGLPMLLVVVDEVQTPLAWGGSLGKQVAEDLLNAARVGRALGVHLVLATQRPDSSAVDTALRAQCTTKLSLKVDNADASRAALGVRAESGWEADSLPSEPKGAAIALGPGIRPKATRLRCFKSDVADARMIVARVQPKSVERPELHLVQDSPRDRPALPEVLRLALAAWPVAGYDAHADILAGCMGWDRGDLVAGMKDLGVPLRAVYMPRTDGENTTQRGFKRDAVDEAKARYAAP